MHDYGTGENNNFGFVNVIGEIGDTYIPPKMKYLENGCADLHYLYVLPDPAQLSCLVMLNINMPKLTKLETPARIKSEGRFVGKI